MKSDSQTGNYQTHIKLPTLIILTFLPLLLLCPADLWARPMSEKQAEKAVRGWLKLDPNPLETPLSKQVREVNVFADDNKEPIYYVVYLQPSGFVIVPADNLVEPIIAFAPAGVYEPSYDNPLGALVSRDVPGRVAAARGFQAAAGNHPQKKDLTRQEAAFQRACFKTQRKWTKLQYYADTEGTTSVSGVSDVWVAPFVESRWGQTTVCGMACYNYYTPPYEPNNPNNYPCGCVATAMAQLIRFYQHPAGTYVWSDMVLQPDCSITPTQRQAIGQLCYDAAESVETTYGSGGSSAYLWKVRDALPVTFDYSNAIDGWNNNNNIGAGLNGMVNPNLDANYPVILGISGDSGGHAVLADGYGYNASTLYHHLNMGWDGSYDAWYNLPDINSVPDYNSIDECIYNVYTSGSGEIISGRVTDLGGGPVSDTNITAEVSGGGTYYATSNNQGIYALAKVPSNATFTISASKNDWSFSSQIIDTGTSTHDVNASGNVWGVNFAGTTSVGFVEFDKKEYTVPEAVIVRLVDSDLQGSDSQDVVVTTCGGDIETMTLSENPVGTGVFTGSVPTAEGAIIVEDGTIQVLQSEVIIATYQDSNDGKGNSATVRDTAAVTCSEVICDANFTEGMPADWSIVDGYSDGYTWAPGNEADWESRDFWDGTLTGDFMIVDSDGAGEVDMDEQLITSGFDCSAYENVTLKFKHQFVYFADESADVDICVDSGPWQNLVRYQGQDVSGQVELDLSSIADGKSNVRIRWHYYNANWDYYWGIDDVQVIGVAMPQLTLGDFEPDCDVDLDDLAVLTSAWLSSPSDDNWDPTCDISEPIDEVINLLDFAVFAKSWLAGVE